MEESTKPKQKDKEPLVLKKEEVLPKTEKIIKEAESAITDNTKTTTTKKAARIPATKIPARSNGADIYPIETKE